MLGIGTTLEVPNAVLRFNIKRVPRYPSKWPHSIADAKELTKLRCEYLPRYS